MQHCFLNWGMSQAARLHEAEVMVVQRPGREQLQLDICWAALLLGAFVVSPDTLSGQVVPHLKYGRSRALRRILYVSMRFRTKHKARYNNLQMLIDLSRGKRVTVDYERYMDYVQGRRRRASAVVCALVTTQDQTLDCFKKCKGCLHVYTALEFFDWVTTFGHARSRWSAASRQ